PPVGSGKVKLRISGDNLTWDERLFDFSGSTFSVRAPVKDSAVVTEGLVRAYAWNDSAEIRGWTAFSKNRIQVHDLQISPQRPLYGDSVQIACRIAVPPLADTPAVQCLYAVDYPYAENPDFSQNRSILMIPDSGGYWHSEQPLAVTWTGRANAALLIKFRISSIAGESTVHTFDIRGTPDLRFTNNNLPVRWSTDSIGVDFEIVNSGDGAAPPFTVSLFFGTQLQQPAVEIHRNDSLSPGETVRFSRTLPDTQGTIPVSARVNLSRAFNEIFFDNNAVSGSLSVVYDTLFTTDDTIWSTGTGLHISPAAQLGLPRTVFLFRNALADSQPLATQSYWLNLTGDSTARYSIGVRPPLSPTDSLTWVFHADTAVSGPGPTKKRAPNLSAKITAMSYDSVAGLWQYAGSDWNELNATVSMTTVAPGPFAAAHLSDIAPPEVGVSVAGRKLVFLDYAAKDKPFDIFITDPSSIVPGSVELLVNSIPLDKNSVSEIPLSGDLESIRLTAYPQKQRSTDSIAICAQDYAGNDTCAVFAYLPGEDLSIRFLACHPNPFTARQNPDGGTAQRIRFAYLLTDVADNVHLTIYTMSGKKIRSWSFSDIVGYQEVEWDGKTQNGYRIANGTYYVRLRAKNDRKDVKKLMKIAKCEGY
ncbi:MAG: hypothetical protein GF350_08540, partial [Chitinivibrionales bacterium]|nr:hypothetical protein [Chitinivibrionales bacterium]